MLRRALATLLRLASRPFVDLTRHERWVLLAVAVLHVTALTWGLPASDTWDVDAIAPRDFLPGVVKTFTPGDYYTYPPFHLLLLALLTLPVTLVALAKSPSLAPPDLVATFISVPVMTTFAIVARVVNALMSLGIVLAMGRISGSIFGPRARAWTMALAGVEVACAYYAHTSNLDIPALFWAALALMVLVDALKEDDPRRLRTVAILAALAIASKDQAYAIFAIAMPVVVVAWTLLTPRAHAKAVLRESALCAVIVIALVLVLDGAPFNPSGFAARVRFLTGHASQDYAMFSKDLDGRIAVLHEAWWWFEIHYPASVAPLVLFGMVAGAVRARGLARVSALVPLLAIASFTLAFNCIARRVEERFMMPQMQLYAVYAGGAIAMVLDAAAASGRAWAVWLVRTGAAACVLSGARLTVCMLLTMIFDARHDAERFLVANVKPGEVIEVYGNNVYFPRFPENARVERVGPGPVGARGPMPNMVEKQDRLSAVNERKPTWIVVSSGYAWRFMDRNPLEGQVIPGAQAAILADQDSTLYIRSLWAGTAGYEKVLHAHYAGFPPVFTPRHLHASLSCDVLVFKRRAGP